MSDISQSFVLQHTFENVNKLTRSDSPAEHHFGYDWCLSVEKNGAFLATYLRRKTKEEDMPPVTVSLSISIKSTDGKETVRREGVNTFVIPNGWGFPSFENWEKAKDKFISNDKLTVETHVDIIKIFSISSIKREFIIVQTVENLTENSENESQVETHFDVPWSLVVKRFENSFKVSLNCKKEKRSNMWWIDTKFNFKLKATDGTVFEENRALTFDEKRKCSVFAELSKWDSVIEKCMKEEKFEVEVHVQIFNMVGISKKPKANFESTENDEYSDVCLKVGGKEFKASKAILARFSPVFRSMFFGGFVEAKSNEVVIEDVDADSFGIFLALIYVYKPEISSSNVRNLLILADRYDIPRVTNKCLKFLLETKNVDLKKKLELADQFHLVDLQEHVLDSLKTSKEVKALRERMGNISITTATALLDKALSFVS